MNEPFTPSFFRRLQQLKIHTRRAYLGSRQGSHISQKRGHGLEFADYRVYAPGDDFRHIDWGIYGRTDRLYVRQFRDEQDLNVFFLIDCSRSMAFPEGEGKFELAIQLALALGYVALSDGDTVVFSLLGQKNSPRYVGAKAISRAFRALSAIKPEGNFRMVDEVRGAVERQRLPGKCFFISDFLIPVEETIETLQLLRSRNYEIALIQILAPSELALSFDSGDALVVDSESGAQLELALAGSSKREYARVLADHVDALERYCRKTGIAHLLTASSEPVTSLVLTRLPELGLLK